MVTVNELSLIHIFTAMNNATIIRPLAHVITTSSGAHKIPVVASHGSAAWIDEEGAYTEGDETFGQAQLDAHKVGTIIKVSEEDVYKRQPLP